VCRGMHGILALPGVNPDFLWRLNAPMSFMRLSSRNAHTQLCRGLRGRKSEGPGFPVEVECSHELHAPFCKEKRINKPVEGCKAGNPGVPDKCWTGARSDTK
jgi:hypothetical protein